MVHQNETRRAGRAAGLGNSSWLAADSCKNRERRKREKLPRQKHGLSKLQRSWISPHAKKSGVVCS